jgi:hypothetical protein
MAKKKYKRAKITEKKITASFFLTPMRFLDQFNMVGNIYGASGATSNTSSGSTSSAGTGSSTGGTSGTNSGTGSC